jgi:DeoR/GlpR family transcriptional regulator of sugar metabolism
MDKAELRRKRLLERLQILGRMDVDSACRELDASPATVRRLFHDLAEAGTVLRIHGGVQLSPAAGFDYSYRQEAERNRNWKREIGRLAASLIADGEKTFLDSGTTVMAAAEAIAARLNAGTLRDVLVVTNSFTAVEILARHTKVILAGGETRIERRDVCGALAESVLERFRFDKAFIGADAIDPKMGLMATDERTARMNELVIARSSATVVLADSDKFGRNSFVSYASVWNVSRIITDGRIAARTLAAMQKAGAKMEILPVGKG